MSSEATRTIIEHRVRLVDGREKDEKVKVVKREVLVPPQVLERKQWAKFGRNSGQPRGHPTKNDFTETKEVRLETLDSVQKDEIDIVQKLRSIDTNAIIESRMKKRL